MSTKYGKVRRKLKHQKDLKTPEGIRGSKAQTTGLRAARRSQDGTGQFTGVATGTRRSKISGRAQRALERQGAKQKQGGGM